MPDIAELGLSIDTRQLEQGAQAMDRLGAASESVEKKVDSATTAIDKLGKASADAKGKTAEGAAAVDAVGEAGARVVQKVDAATASIDAMGATANRIRTVFLGGSNTLDGFMGSSMGVWRSSEAAASGIDSLGNATERTWKKQADYNGAMADTTRIMRQAAEAARTLEESNHRMLMQLQREIDTFGMARGELERYRAAELGLGSAAQTKAAALGNSIDAMHREERAARDAASAQDRAAQAGDRFIKSLQDQVATLGMTTQQLQTYRAAQLGVSDAASPLINKLAEAGAGAKSAGGHMEGLSFQSASAKRELLVLAHELSQGQFQRFGGSMMVLGEQTGAAGLLFSAAGLAALAFAAALGTVAYAMIKGASQQREMNNALISTNNYAGATSDSLNEMARAATTAGGSIREAKKVVTDLAGSGKFTSEQIGYITSAVIALEYAGSSSAKNTIKEFESLAVQMTGNGARSTEAITRAALKLDDTYHFLTIEVFAHIRALEKEGDQKAASALATLEFAKAGEDGAKKMLANLSDVAHAWHEVTKAIGDAVDAIGEFGQKNTPAKDVKNYSFRLNEFDRELKESNVRLGRAPDSISPEMDATRTKIVLGLTAAVEKLNIAQAEGIGQGDEQQKKSALMHDMQRMQAADDKRKEESLGRLNIELEKNRRTQQGLIDLNSSDPLILAMITPEAIEARRLATIKEFSKKPTAAKVDQPENIHLSAQLKQFERETADTKAHFDALGKLDDLYFRAGNLSAEQSYENKRSYALATYEAEVDGYQRELAALKRHKSATKAEEERHQKEIEAIQGKLDGAEKTFFADRKYRDEEERLRKDALTAASNDAMNKYVSSINQEAQKIEEANRGREVSRGSIEREAVAQLDLAIAYQKQFMAGQAAAGATEVELAQAPAILKYLEDQRSARARLAQGLDAQSDAKHMENLANQAIKDWDRAGKSIADSLSTAFGNGGKAIGQMFKAYSEGVAGQLRAQKELREAKKLSDDNPDRIAAINRAQLSGATAQIKSYADMTTAAQGFFSEGSRGYQAMAAASQVMHAAEVALTVVKGINAVLTQGEGDPYTAFGRMAAMAAVVAALGVAIGGVSGTDTTAKDRQAATGTGTALGDSSAKSESIAHSLAIMEKNSGLGLAYSSSMVVSLKQIVSGIGGLGSLLVRTSGVTGAIAADSKGGAAAFGASTMGVALTGGIIGLTLDKLTGGLIGKITGGVLGSIFGGKVSTLDTGLTASKASLSQVLASGMTTSQYTDIKKSGGWFSSDKYSSPMTALGAEADGQFTKIILGMRSTIVGAADALGMGGDAFTARLNTFVVDLGKISLKDLKGDELQKALESAFSKLGDDMAKFGVGGLEKYQAVGEGYLETLARVANNYMQVSDVLAVLGKSFNTTGLGAVALSESLIAAAGGLETLTSGTSYFVENFLTEAERMAPITKSVNDAMGKLGHSGVTTVEQFKALVMAQDLNTAAGQSMYAQLIAIAEPFKKAADYAAELAGTTGDLAAANKTASEIASERRDLQKQLNELTKSETELLAIQRAGIADINKALFDQVQAAKAVVSAKDALAKAYDTESAAAKTALEKSKAWVTTLNGLNASMNLGNQSILTPEQKYAEARAQFEKTLAAANAGDTTAQSGLSAAEQAFLSASQVVNASDAKYAADYARVIAANQDAAKWAAAQVDVQQASLDALKAQVSGLITINDSVLTVAQAIANLHVAMGTATGLGVQFDGSHAGGLANVPFDGYAAELHEGEVVVDAPAAAAMRRYFGGAPSQGGGNTDALVAEIRGLREDNKGMREEIKGLRADQGKQTGAAIQATVESNAVAAKTVVDGIDKSARAAARVKQVEYSK
ncbi:phage tail length tape measure family protein [Janthinobacterium sp. SUN118]|uniref:phage tail length tape measure family protein n=1 Tax=Janthinobacterium sp. SUN118 TaxID=3004100 RepID=UPI0025AEED4E|nr:phage tail length tape measure family protein [Janthinobacterium sp. SUN118]MDN2710598.1 phage tail length tape measure family protein [Janthinobacterium sp. SUN118]